MLFSTLCCRESCEMASESVEERGVSIYVEFWNDWGCNEREVVAGAIAAGAVMSGWWE